MKGFTLALALAFALWRKLTGPPDAIIGDSYNPYMYRWYILPKVANWPRVYVHKFLRSDDDRALHDHPWAFLSILLWGNYIEVTDHDMVERTPGSVAYRPITHRHRVMLCLTNDRLGGPAREKPCWTLFITGPERRDWGFWCNGETGERFIPSKQFVGCE